MREAFVPTFLYTENGSPYEGFFHIPLAGFKCKHVMGIRSEKAKALFTASKENGYLQVIWGYGTGIYLDEAVNREIQIHTIRNMIYKCRTAPLRVVVDRAGVPWVDNLHSAIKHILVFGDGVTLSDIPFYLVDLSGDVPVILNHNGSLSDRIPDILGSLDSARKRDARADDAVRAVGYTIGEFMEENRITKEAVHLPEKYYRAYRDALKGV